MNTIYDFNDISETRKRQNALILRYVLYALCFVLILAAEFLLIGSHLLTVLAFALTSLLFALFSIVFWKVKYGILAEYRSFLDDLEMGRHDDCIGVFQKKISGGEDGSFDTYCFCVSGKSTSCLVHIPHAVSFSEGERYHLECVGCYLLRWEKV